MSRRYRISTHKNYVQNVSKTDPGGIATNETEYRENLGPLRS